MTTPDNENFVESHLLRFATFRKMMGLTIICAAPDVQTISSKTFGHENTRLATTYACRTCGQVRTVTTQLISAHNY